ncbi:MAG: hypothetical protein IJX76_05580 [Clostridia bacterium]|nr:hypothetical protein [Clostridia bacterium]
MDTDITSPSISTVAILDVEFDFDEKKPVLQSDIVNLKSGMTLGSIVESIGSPHPSEYSGVRYPLLYSWETEDGNKLYIKFETDDYDEFIGKYQNGDFVLPNEELIYDESGIRLATPNEVKVLKEWVNSYQAVYAYMLINGEKTILFSTD